MGLQLLTESPDKVIPDNIAEGHLRRDSSDELTLIQLYRDAATQAVENNLRRKLLQATYLLTLEDFPSRPSVSPYSELGDRRGEIVPPILPFKEVVTLKYVNTDGTLTTMAPTDYQVDATCKPAMISPAAGNYWPTVKPYVPNAVQLTFKAGYDNAEKVPAAIKAGILLMMGTLYAERADVITGTITDPLPDVVTKLLHPYILWWNT